jgi:hypothetical protein
MHPVRRAHSPLAAVLALAVGLLLGAGIGLPTAHWVAGFLLAHPGVAAASPGGPGHPSTSAPSELPSTPAASSPGTPAASPPPTAPPPTCSPLASGQQPLDPLRPPPSGYAADATLDWVGCGVETLPAAAPFTVGGSWLVAVSYSCPTGVTAAATGSTLTVSESGGLAGSAAEAIAESRGDDGDVIQGGLDGTTLGPGTYRLTVAAAPACLWHLAVYRGQGTG